MVTCEAHNGHMTYTATSEPFDFTATYVVAGDWCVSYRTSTAYEGCMLSAFRVVDGEFVHHADSGKMFPNRDQARIYAYYADLLERYVR